MQVKITLEDTETIDEAQEMLAKALLSHTNGDAHAQESFKQPLANLIVLKMQTEHQEMLKRMYKQIQALVGKELMP